MADESGFDVDAWKAEGQQALDKIESKILLLKEQMLDLVRQRDEIEKALGIYEAPKESSKPTKVILRPILLQLLLEEAPQSVATQNLIDAVQHEKPTAKASSIRTSLKRLAKNHPKVEALDDGESYRHSGLEEPE